MVEMRQRYTYYLFQFSIVKGRQTDFRVNSLQKSGIDKLLPHMKIDDYLFDPCGYSMNGVLQNVRRYDSDIILNENRLQNLEYRNMKIAVWVNT